MIKEAPYIAPVNFSAIKMYNKEWKLEQIIVFNKILANTRRTGLFVIMATSRLEKELRMGKDKIITQIKGFQELGYIKKIPTAKKKANRYEVNGFKIVEDVKNIFDLTYDKNDSTTEEDMAEVYSNYLKNHLTRFYYFDKSTKQYIKIPKVIDLIKDNSNSAGLGDDKIT